MSTLQISLLGYGHSRIMHQNNHKEIITRMMQKNAASSYTFSSTDLLGAALASCIASSLEAILLRNNIPLKDVSILINKTLTAKNRLPAFNLDIKIDQKQPGDHLQNKLEKVAHSCMVHRSLRKEVEVSIHFNWAEDKVVLN